MIRLCTGLLAGLLAFPAAALAQAQTPAQTPAPVQTNVVRDTLANGMHVILLPNHLAPVATTLVSYDVGSDDDPAPGIAHATEHMLFRGTKDVTAGQFSDIAARMGADYNAFTANENTLYYFHLPSSYVDVALRLEADRMTQATILPRDWQTERGAIEQEIRAQQSQPTYKIGNALRERFFAGTPFATAGGGTVPSFEKMTAADISRFYHTWYVPNNATLIVAGDINPTTTMAQIHRLFDPIAKGTLPVRKPMNVPPLQTSTMHDVIDFPLPLGALAYRLPGTDDKDHAAALLLQHIFNSGRGSLADLSASGKVLGAFNIQSAFPEVGASFFAVVPAAGQQPQPALDLVSKILDDYRTSGLPPELIHAAKQSLLSETAYEASSIRGLAFAWAQAIEERHPSLDEEYATIATLTDDDVNRVFRQYFTPDHRLTVVMDANPKAGIPKVDPSAGVENVRYESDRVEPLPAWARTALNAKLSVPVDQPTVTTHLPNGLTVTVRREAVSPTVALHGEIRMSPQLYEPAHKEGVADITDSLLEWGTATYDRKQYVAQFENISADADLGGRFELKSQTANFSKALSLLADGMLHPVFPANGFEVTKGKSVQALAAAEKLPKARAERAAIAALYPVGDPRRRAATAASVSHVTLDDVKHWYHFAYRPDLTTIAIVGDVDPAQATALVKQYFGNWSATGKKPSFRYPQLHQSTTGRDVTVKSATNTQSEVTLTQILRVRPGDRDYVPLLLANTMLSGEGTGSLLFQDLRVRHGYVYSVDSDLTIDSSSSSFTLSFSSDPKNVRRAQAQAVALLRSLERQGPQQVEVQRAKALLLAQRVLPLDSYDGVASDILSDAKFHLTKRDSDRFWFELVTTTAHDVQDALRRNIYPDRFVKVEVAPE